MQQLLVDGDPLVYEAGFAVQKTHYDVSRMGHMVGTFTGKTAFKEWLVANKKTAEDFTVTERVELKPIWEAKSILAGKIYALVKETKAEQLYVFLTSCEKGVNFRDYLAVSRKYKDRHSKRPEYYTELRDYLVEAFDAKVCIGYEADDAVAMLQYQALEEGQSSAIATVDKDLDMIPGWHFNYQKKSMAFITPEEALYAFYSQLLKGDTVDTIPGLKGIGPKKAEAILEGCEKEEQYHAAVSAAYEEAHGARWERVMIEQARLLWMLRFPGDRWFPYGSKERKAQEKADEQL